MIEQKKKRFVLYVQRPGTRQSNHALSCAGGQAHGKDDVHDWRPDTTLCLHRSAPGVPPSSDRADTALRPAPPHASRPPPIGRSPPSASATPRAPTVGPPPTRSPRGLHVRRPLPPLHLLSGCALIIFCRPSTLHRRCCSC